MRSNNRLEFARAARPTRLKRGVRAQKDMSDATNQRPASATFLALVLAWLAIAGFGNAVAWRALPSSTIAQLPPPLSAFVEATQSPLFTLLALSYGTTALFASVGLWRMRTWKGHAFFAWSVSALIFGFWLVWSSPQEFLTGGRLIGALFVALVGMVLGLVYRYVKHLSPRIQHAAL
jgi:hypothetical protein